MFRLRCRHARAGPSANLRMHGSKQDRDIRVPPDHSLSEHRCDTRRSTPPAVADALSVRAGPSKSRFSKQLPPPGAAVRPAPSMSARQTLWGKQTVRLAASERPTRSHTPAINHRFCGGPRHSAFGIAAGPPPSPPQLSRSDPNCGGLGKIAAGSGLAPALPATPAMKFGLAGVRRQLV